MRRPIHQARVPRIDILQSSQPSQEPFVDQNGCRVPAGVGHEPAVEDVEAAQILDGKMAAEAIAQLTRGKQAKAQGNAVAIAKLDLALVNVMIELEMARLVDRVDKDCRGAADGAH